MAFEERFPRDVRASLRRELLARGKTLATLLADVLAGKAPAGPVSAANTPLDSAVGALLAARPGKRPAEVLRLALDQVEGRRALLDAGDDRYGRCAVCGAELGLVALGEMPWADRCAEHAMQ